MQRSNVLHGSRFLRFHDRFFIEGNGSHHEQDHDCHHDQQFDERESAPSGRKRRSLLSST
jgi:hypothetical protein